MAPHRSAGHQVLQFTGGSRSRSGLWWLFSGDSPDEVSLDAATEQVAGAQQDESVDDVEVADDDPVAADDGQEVEDESSDITGTGPTDVDCGEFDYESATGSFGGFRIEEELSGIGSTTAVGRTSDVTGELTIVVVGSIDIVFADYGVEVPESQIVVSVEDSGILEFQLLFVR